MSEAKIEKITDPQKYNKYRIYFWAFTILTILSLLDMMTRDIMSSKYEITNGFISLVIGAIFSIFGESFGAIMMVVFDTIFSLVLIWIILIFVMKSKMKKLKK